MSLRKGLVGHWTMDVSDTNGDQMIDRSAYENHGTIYNSPDTGVNGRVAESVYYPGTSQSIDVVHSDELHATDGFTVCLWMNLDSHQDQNNGNTSHHIYKSNDWGMIDDTYFIAGDSTGRVGTNPSIPTGEWVHTALRFDGDTVEVINNATVVSSVGFSETMSNSTSMLRIGNAGGRDWTTHGHMDDLRVYRRYVSNKELNQLMNMRNPQYRRL